MTNPFLEIQNDLVTIKGLLLDLKNERPLTLNKLPDEEILSVQDAASFVGLKVPTIYSLVSHRKIPFSKNGKKLMFLKSELLQWVKSGRKATHAELEVLAQKFSRKKQAA